MVSRLLAENPRPPFPDNSRSAHVDLWISLATTLTMGIGCFVLPVAVIVYVYWRQLRVNWKATILTLDGLASGCRYLEA